MTIRGGDFGKAGKRGGGEFTLDRLRDLLEDDVKNLTRMAFDPKLRKECAGDATNVSNSKLCDISDDELGMIMDRERVFAADSDIPVEGDMYDIIPVENGQLQGVQW